MAYLAGGAATAADEVGGLVIRDIVSKDVNVSIGLLTNIRELVYYIRKTDVKKKREKKARISTYGSMR